MEYHTENIHSPSGSVMGSGGEGVAVSFLFLLMISRHSAANTKVLNAENEKLTRAALEYTRGLPVVKSFGMEGASVRDFMQASASAKRIALKIEWGFIPYNCLWY